MRAPSPWIDAFVDRHAGEPSARPDVEELRSHVNGDRVDIDLTDTVTPMVEELTAWRRAAAHAARIETGAVLSDGAIALLAQHRPASEAELAAVPGVGAAKARRFGSVLLAITSPAR
ncbi:MAG: HRDC domain-containing protein [Acidimicrobiales bacterium]